MVIIVEHDDDQDPNCSGEEAQAQGANNGGGGLPHGSFNMQTEIISPHNSAHQQLQDSGSNSFLNLSKTPTLMRMMEEATSSALSNNTIISIPRQIPAPVPQQAPKKLDAIHFYISKIIIGDWKVESTNNGDLTAKCYFARKKLLWEVLAESTQYGELQRLKSKLEISWSDILSLSASFHEDQSSELNIELNHPPTFYHEIIPEPRKRSQWKLTTDFTYGLASRCRRHKLSFAPGVLQKHYEKLVHSDPHLHHCSQVLFPSLASPYFDDM